MSVEFKTAQEVASTRGIKSVVAGAAGTGKTTLVTTCPQPICLMSAESGLISIRNTKADIKIVEVKTIADIGAVLDHLEAKCEFQTVAIDSISEIAEIVLANELARTADGRKAYGELNIKMMGILKAFRDLDAYHVLVTAKQDRVQDDGGKFIYSPSMPGRQLALQLPYLFDLVMAMRVVPDDKGNHNRWLQTGTDLQYTAKDRSGKLDMFEEPDFSSVCEKILGKPATPAKIAKAA
jgi:hypothetical protein